VAGQIGDQRTFYEGSRFSIRVMAVLLYDGMLAFDLGVAVEVWGIDRTEAGVPPFELRRCSVGGQAVSGEPASW
jgi:hypothetical protein